jgi:hypothetical protein
MIKFLNTPVARVDGKDLYLHDVLLVPLVCIFLTQQPPINCSKPTTWIDRLISCTA